MIENRNSDKASILIITQVYVPDPAAAGQQMHDAASELARRGFRVRVVTSARGYDDPSQRYKAREVLDGVEIHRLPLASFGKSSLFVRLLANVSFLSQAALHAFIQDDIYCVLINTAPPLAPLVGIALKSLRNRPVVFWVMDINPDQAIALGQVAADSRFVQAFEWMNRRILRSADLVITLDRYMAETLNKQLNLGNKLVVHPPWPLTDTAAESVAHTDNPFRIRLGLQDKFIVMYSGNFSIAHPLTTALDAARLLRDKPTIHFLFIGSGLGREEILTFVKRHGLNNISLLPYQPLSELGNVLSTADIHLVSMGERMVGVVHLSKVYGVMAVARPILLLGPANCFIAELINDERIGYRVDHGDADGCASIIARLAEDDRFELEQMGKRAQEAAKLRYGRERLRNAFCDEISAFLATQIRNENQ